MRTEMDSPNDIAFSDPEPKPMDTFSNKAEAGAVKVRILKPLASSEDLVRTKCGRHNLYAAKTNRNAWLTRRALSVGGGSLAVLAITILCGLFFAMPDSASGTLDVANAVPNDRQVKRSPRPPKEPGTFVPFPVTDDPPMSTEINPAYELLNEVVKPNRTTPRTVTAAYKSRPRSRRPALIMSKFVPTTLIIYPENGVIKTRIEPQLTAVYKK
jgi:hypothetical protein